jgi:DNA mismatch repair protein MSH3
MAPHSSQSSAPSPSLKRKQATISSFFTQKPASTAPKYPEVPPTKTPKKRQASPIEKTNESQQEDIAPAGDDEDDEDIVAPAPKRAKMTGTDAEEPIRVAASMPFEHPSHPSSQRTDIYKFQSSPAVATAPVDNEDPEQENQRREKERLHKQFVQKLGGTDCQIGIRRTAVNDVANAEAEAAEAEEDDEPPPPPTKGKGAKKAGSKLTPMEKQVIEIKRQHMDTVMVIEVGYKFRFFGEDARTAAKELGIVCIPGKFRFDERKCTLPVYQKIICSLFIFRPLGSTHRSVCFS